MKRRYRPFWTVVFSQINMNSDFGEPYQGDISAEFQTVWFCLPVCGLTVIASTVQAYLSFVMVLKYIKQYFIPSLPTK